MLKEYSDIIKKSGFTKLEINDILKKKLEKNLINLKDVNILNIISENFYLITEIQEKTKNDIKFYLNIVLIFKVYPEILNLNNIGFKFISLANIIKGFYYSLTSYTNDFKIIVKYIKIIVKILFESNLLYKVDVKRNKTFKNIWVLKIEESDYDLLYEFKKNFEVFITYNKPYKWFLKDNEKVISEAYLKSKDIYEVIFLNSIFTKGKMIEDNHIKTFFNNEIIEYINRLQSIPFKFEINLFLNIFKKYSILEYLKNDSKNFKYDIFLNTKYEEHILKNQEFYYSKRIKDINKIFKYIKFKNMDEDLSAFSLTVQDIDVLNFLYNYNNEYLYSYLFLDHRGRLYTKGNISYINSTLLRMLVKFDDKPLLDKDEFYKYYISSQLNKNIKSIKEGVEYYNSLNIFEIKNINYSKIEEFNCKTISLDATSSMIQIIALLTKNYKLMFYTNLIEHHEKVDIYDYIINIISENIDKDNIFYEYYTSRKYVKYSIMLYIFGSQPLYTAKSLYSKHNLRSIHLKDLTTIISYIIKIFKNEFPVVKELISVMKKYIKRSITKKKKIQVNTMLKKTIYTCPSIKNLRINYENKIVLGLRVLSQFSSEKKAKKSFFVNIIHSLDSEICILTRNDLLEKGIKTLSVHDCFILNIENYKDVLFSYNKNLKNILKIELFDLLPDIDTYITKKELQKLKKFSTIVFENYENNKCFYSLKPE